MCLIREDGLVRRRRCCDRSGARPGRRCQTDGDARLFSAVQLAEQVASGPSRAARSRIRPCTRHQQALAERGEAQMRLDGIEVDRAELVADPLGGAAEWPRPSPGAVGKRRPPEGLAFMYWASTWCLGPRRRSRRRTRSAPRAIFDPADRVRSARSGSRCPRSAVDEAADPLDGRTETVLSSRTTRASGFRRWTKQSWPTARLPPTITTLASVSIASAGRRGSPLLLSALA